MTAVHIFAIVLGKRSFQVCAMDRGGAWVGAPCLARRLLKAVRERGILSVVCQASRRGLSSHGPGCSSKNRDHIGSESFVLERRDWFTPF